MLKRLINKVKRAFTKEEKGRYIDFTVDDEVSIGNEIEEVKICSSSINLKTREERKRERLQSICTRTRKFRIRKKLIRRMVDSFVKEGYFDE